MGVHGRGSIAALRPNALELRYTCVLAMISYTVYIWMICSSLQPPLGVFLGLPVFTHGKSSLNTNFHFFALRVEIAPSGVTRVTPGVPVFDPRPPHKSNKADPD